MSYAIDDAKMWSAREILFLCRGKLSEEIRNEKSRNQPDAQRVEDMELVMSQLRDEIDAVQAGDRVTTTRVRVLYGMLLKATHAKTRSERVIALVESISGDQTKAIQWMNEPLKDFGGKTPFQLIAEDRTESLIGYIQSFESGFVG